MQKNGLLERGDFKLVVGKKSGLNVMFKVSKVPAVLTPGYIKHICYIFASGKKVNRRGVGVGVRLKTKIFG